MEDCIFCKIIKEEIPCNKVYEDKNTLAFLDINPVNKGHTLVIPKNHSKNILDVQEKDLLNIMKTVKKLTPIIKEAVKADGINVSISNESAAGQAVFHIHVHIMPRFKEDGLKLFPQGKYQEGEAKQIQDKIKNLLK